MINQIEDIENKIRKEVETAFAKRDKVISTTEKEVETLAAQVAMLIVSYGEVAIFSESVLEHLFKNLPEDQRSELLASMNERREQMLETLNNSGVEVDINENNQEGTS